MNPPRPNEGIDVRLICDRTTDGEAIIEFGDDEIRFGAELGKAKEVMALIARVRAETEAVVTKREREKMRPLIKAIKKNHKPAYGESVGCRDLCNALTAYESNDAGESQ